MKKKKITAIILLSVFVLCAVGYLIYSRPMTIQQRYPALDLDQCTEVYGYYQVAGGEFTQLTIDQDSEAFAAVCSIVYEQSYRRSLLDLFKPTTLSHSPAPGDFQWEVVLSFEGAVLPDGSTTPASIIDIRYFYGELSILYARGAYDSVMHYVRTKNQETWATEVLNAIT